MDILMTLKLNSNAPIADTMDWTDATPEKVGAAINSVVNRIDAENKVRQLRLATYFRFYTNRMVAGLYPWLYNTITTNNNFVGRGADAGAVQLNVVASCIDSVSAKLASNKPRVQFLTVGGSYAQQRRAKQLTAYMDGVFDQLKLYDLGSQAFVDSCVFGLGAIKLFIDDDKLCAARILPNELLVDDIDGLYGTPAQLHQRQFMSKTALIAEFPDFDKIIRAAAPVRNGTRTVSDLIPVTESWYLNTRHCITLNDNTVLLDEPYDRDTFPFVFLRWKQLSVGFWGSGLAEELSGIQLEINRLLENIRHSQRLMSVPKILIDNHAGINTNVFNRDVGGIIRYNQTPPQFMVPPAQSAEIYSHLERLIDKAYEITGVSQLSASQQKPAGVESGVALRTLQDVESQRFLLTAQRYESVFVEMAQQIIDLSEELPTNSVFLKSKNQTLERLTWKDVRMDKDSYMLQAYPTNILPKTPEGKLATVQDLLQAGMINQSVALSLLDLPDLDAQSSLWNAALDNIQWVCEQLSEGEFVTPSPLMNLSLAIDYVREAYLKAQAHGEDQKILELHKVWIAQATALVQQQQAAQQPRAPQGQPQVAQQQPRAPQGQPQVAQQQPPTAQSQ